MYTVKNYQSKKALVEDFKAGKRIECFQPGPFGPEAKDGVAVIEGPHYPQPHRFYVEVTLKDGAIVAIKGVKRPTAKQLELKPLVKGKVG